MLGRGLFQASGIVNLSVVICKKRKNMTYIAKPSEIAYQSKLREQKARKQDKDRIKTDRIIKTCIYGIKNSRGDWWGEYGWELNIFPELAQKFNRSGASIKAKIVHGVVTELPEEVFFIPLHEKTKELFSSECFQGECQNSGSASAPITMRN
jgi:hypothetical protein